MPGTRPATDARSPALGLERREGDGPITLRDRRRGRSRREAPALRLVESRPPILVVGVGTPHRDALVADLTETLPPGTRFEELSTLGDMLERAPSSRMVIVDGGFEGISASGVMRILAQRHPQLPVIRLDGPGIV
jgi:hypothetical protein